jgi:hypothetical protein
MVSPLFPFSSGRPECERNEVTLIRSSALAVRMPGAGGGSKTYASRGDKRGDGVQPGSEHVACRRVSLRDAVLASTIRATNDAERA